MKKIISDRNKSPASEEADILLTTVKQNFALVNAEKTVIFIMSSEDEDTEENDYPDMDNGVNSSQIIDDNEVSIDNKYIYVAQQ